MKSVSFLLLICLFMSYANGYKNRSSFYVDEFDFGLYKRVINPISCRKQMDYLLHNNTLLLAEFLDAGIRLPTGLMLGNLVDLGNFYQCLGIHEEISNAVIDGKYCLIEVPMKQTKMKFPSFLPLPKLPELHIEKFKVNNSRLNLNILRMAKKYYRITSAVNDTGNDGNITAANLVSEVSLTLAVCIPKVCTTQQALDGLSYNLATSTGFEFKDKYCRLPNDKPWVTADHVALALFSIIGLLTLLSTAYDLHHTVFLQKDPKQANKICQSFSVYNNTRRLVTYTPVPGTLECLDGIRTLAAIWVIIGHTFMMQVLSVMANPMNLFEWLCAFESVWILSAPITVETFFVVSGLLLVYTVAGKFTRKELVKNLHLFYSLRILRMFPMLATTVLLQASLMNHVADGPYWDMVAKNVRNCRQYWWSTLLHVQNIASPDHDNLCLQHSWFLAIDVQLHILSPLVLFWILGGRKRTACLALTIAMLLALIPATVYNFKMGFPGSLVVLSQIEKHKDYLKNYYMNTFTRASSYFVGMIFGYILHLYRDEKVVIPKALITLIWSCATVMSSAIIYSVHPMVQLDWDNQTVDAIANSFMRPVWSILIGWLVFACEKGYGGPINWMLSLRMWKVPSRLSYSMYLVHYPLIQIVYASSNSPSYFSTQFHFTKFLSDLLLTMLAAFILTVLVESPFLVLINHFIGSKRPKKNIDNGIPKSAPKIECDNEVFTKEEIKNNFKYIPHE